MIAFLLVLFMVGFLAFCTSAFFGWVLKEHLDAERYRKGVIPIRRTEVKKDESTEPRWSFSFRDGRLLKTVIIRAASEKEALGQFIRDGNDFKSILSINKL